MKNSHSKIFHNRSLPHTIHATDVFPRDVVDVDLPVSTPFIDIHINPIVSLVHDIVGQVSSSTTTATSRHESETVTRTPPSSLSPTFISSPSSSSLSSLSNNRTSVVPASASSVVGGISSALGSNNNANGPFNTFIPGSQSSSTNFIPGGSFTTHVESQSTQIPGNTGVSNDAVSAIFTPGSGSDGHTDNDLQSTSTTGTGMSGGDVPTGNQEGDGKHGGELSPGVISAIILAILFSILVVVIFLCRRRRRHRRDQTTLGWRSGGSENRDSLSESFHRTIPSTGSTRSRSSSFSDGSSIYSSPSMSERTTESHPASYYSNGGRSQLSIITPRPNYIDQPLETPTKEAFIDSHPPLSPSAEQVLLIKTPPTPTQSEYESGSSSTRINRVNYPVITSYRPLTGKIPTIPPLPSSPPPVPDTTTFGNRTNPFNNPETD